MKKAIEKILQESKLKITEGRIMILSLLIKNKKPLSIDDIKKEATDIDQSTLYRMLSTFVEKGIVYQTDFRNGKAYFEYQESHHHHMVCTECGVVEEVDVCVKKDFNKVEKKLKKFDRIKSHMLEFFGVCKKCSILFALIFSFFFSFSNAQVLHEDLKGTYKGSVVEIIEEEERFVPGTETSHLYQTLEIEIKDGDRKGEVIVIENDFLELDEGDKFYFNHYQYIDGSEIYAVMNIDRKGSLLLLTSIFILSIIAFGGWQGVRSLISLLGSFLAIFYVLIPGILNGWNPMVSSLIVASTILFIAIFFTHGFNRESAVAYAGTMIAVLITTIFAIFSVGISDLSGFAADESVYLNFNTDGLLNFKSLLLGSIIIGILGVLDDISITQAAVVTELYNSDKSIKKKDVYKKAIRIGREHVSALVNTLVLAYAGASMSLLIYLHVSESSFLGSVNTELLATEIVRTIVGSVGLIMTVPIVTLLAVIFLKDYKSDKKNSHCHHAHIK
jgi:uncharacterized membrane protein